MSLDLPALAPQLAEAGISAAEALERRRQLLPEAEQAFEALAGMAPSELERRLDLAGNKWSGAKPTHEPVDASFTPEPITSDYQIIASDGSQIYPDRHAAAHYYLINTGSIQLQPDSGQAPQVSSRPRLYYSPNELYDENGSPLSTEFINGQRDVAEMAELSRLAAEAGEILCLALLDNGLLLWLALQVRDQAKERESVLIEQYLQHMTELKMASTALAGVIDRPRHNNLLALAYLGQLPYKAIDESINQANAYRGINDASIMMSRLAVGERSALFSVLPGDKRFRGAGHEICFFYLRTSEEGLARVEVPEWVAHDAGQVALVHAGILVDSRSSGGYPYTLARAHELALVTSQEKRRLDELLFSEFSRHGLEISPSAKATMKTWLGRRRRHRL